MTGAFEVDWSHALDDWRRLSYDEAEEVARAVYRFAHGDGGLVIEGEGGSFLLLVGVTAIEMLIDGTTIYVTRVRHA